MMEENHRLRRERDGFKEQIEENLSEKVAYTKKIESLTVLAEENKGLKIKMEKLKAEANNLDGSLEKQGNNQEDFLKVKKMNNSLL